MKIQLYINYSLKKRQKRGRQVQAFINVALEI